jgi:hypothetical protein
MKTLKFRKRNLLYILLVAVFTGCTPYEQPPCNEKRANRIVIAKTTEQIESTAFDRGYVNYKLAFNDGFTDNVSFGEYSCINIGDTILYTKCQNDWYWKAHINCH